MIRAETDGGVLTLTIDRAEKANSLTEAMLTELGDHVLAAAPDIGLIILTGAGDKVFSAGADLEAAKTGLAVSPAWERLSGAVAAARCLTIAALNGTLAGGACGMALACDLRLAVAHANVFYPVARLGYLPQPSDPIRMARLIGPARTKLILAAGTRLKADEALSFGLIDRIVGDPVAEARAMAVGEAAHVAAIKAMVP